MTALRVALLNDTVAFAGTERHLLDLACGLQNLRNEGVEVRIACPTPSPLADRANAVGLEVLPLQQRGLANGGAIITLRRLLKSGEIHLIHAHNGRTALLSTLAVRLARRGDCIATQHYLEPQHLSHRGFKAALHRRAHRWMNRKIAHFIAISQAARHEMLARGDAPADKITVVPNGIAPPDPSTLRPPTQIREELNISPTAPLIVCVARLEREKDIPSLITAMSTVVNSCPAARCIIAGDGAQKEVLFEQIRHSGLESNVRLLGFRADAMSLIQAGDLFVLPSLAEPFGLVLLEAMALGKAVIATCAGGPREIVTEQTGVLVPPANPVALAQAILDLLKDEATRRALGQQGHERFQQEYTALRMATATLDVYRKALS